MKFPQFADEELICKPHDICLSNGWKIMIYKSAGYIGLSFRRNHETHCHISYHQDLLGTASMFGRTCSVRCAVDHLMRSSPAVAEWLLWNRLY